MDAEENTHLRRRVSALESRVARLESLLPAALPEIPPAPPEPRATAQPSLPSLPAFSAPALSFTPPEQPSLESRIGSQVFNRIGIVALLIGVAWCLKYAFDREWLGPAARIGVGLVAGLLVLAWSGRFRRRGYPVFAYSLQAVGTGMLYLSLWAAYSVFHLLGYPAAFAGMVLVTAGNGALCWAQRSDVLALYVAIGGFLTPVLLGGEQASVLALGGYLLLLNAGLLTLAALRRWPRLLGAAFFGTAGYLLSFAFHASSLRAMHQAVTAQSLTLLFFALFSGAPLFLAILHAAPMRTGASTGSEAGSGARGAVPLTPGGRAAGDQNGEETADEIADKNASETGGNAFAQRTAPTPIGRRNSPILAVADPRELAALVLGNAALSYFELWRLLPAAGSPSALPLNLPPDLLRNWLPLGFALWFAAAATIFGPMRAAARLHGVPTILFNVHAALFAAFAALGCWTVLPGAATIPGWAVEAAILLSLSLRPGCPVPLRSPLPTALLLGAATFLLLADSFLSSLGSPRHVLWNGRFALFILLISLSVFAVRIAARHHTETQQAGRPAPPSGWTAAAGGSALLASALLLLAGSLEIHTFCAGTGGAAEQFSYSAWAALLGVVLLALGFRIRWAFLRWEALGLLTLAAGKVFAFDTRSLSQGFRILSFLGLGVLLLLVSFIYQRDLLHLRGREHGG